MSIAVLGMINETSDLYLNGIWESEPLGIPMRNPNTWEQIPQLFIDKSNCEYIDNKDKTIDCLYNLDQNKILNIQNEIEQSIVQLEKFMDVCILFAVSIFGVVNGF